MRKNSGFSDKKSKILKISLHGENNSNMVIKTESTPGNKENTVNQANLNTQTSKISDQKPRHAQNKENQDEEPGSFEKSQTELTKNSNQGRLRNNEPGRPYSRNQSGQVRMNNYMKPDTCEDSSLHKAPYRGSGLELSQNEDEEDFLKANSSKLNTEKNSKAEEKKDFKNEWKGSGHGGGMEESIRTDSEKEIQVEQAQNGQNSQGNPNKNKIFEEDGEIDSEGEMFENQQKSIVSGNVHFHEDQNNSSYLKEVKEKKQPLDAEFEEKDYTEDDEELALVAEPEAVDVSVCTENLEEFDHDESPIEVIDSEEEHEDEEHEGEEHEDEDDDF